MIINLLLGTVYVYNNEMLIIIFSMISGCHTVLTKYFLTLLIFTYLLTIKPMYLNF